MNPMEATFYRFSKKVNSMAVPTGSGRTFEITLKAPTSVTAPVIVLRAEAFSYNYCYIPDFKRYYFVSSTRILRNQLIEYTLAVDVLASYRSQILASTLYVLRSASDYNRFIPDQTWMHTTDYTESYQSQQLTGYNSTGCYLVSVVGDPQHTSGESANPASTLYVMPPSAFKLLLGKMFDLSGSPYSGMNLTDLEATYFNPFQYITSVRWIPFNITNMVAEHSMEACELVYGWYHSGINAYVLKSYGRRITQTFTVGTYTDWTDRDNNWTRHVLYVPSCGLVEIDAAYTGKTVTVDLDIDYNTGQTFCTIKDGTGKILAQTSGILGSEVAINQIATELNIPSSISGAVAAGISVAGGAVARGGKAIADTAVNFGNVVGANMAIAYSSGLDQAAKDQIADIASASGSAALVSGKEAAAAIADSALQTFLNPTVTRAGADGCRFTIMQNHEFILYTRKYSRFNTGTESQVGGVCNQMKQLSTLSGYTVCANGVVEVPGLLEERNAITSLLEGGFYIA